MSELSQIVGSVRLLSDSGLERSRSGTWSLGQLCEHMAKAIEGSLPHADLGPPVAPRWLGRLVKALLLRTGYMPPGTPAPRPFRPDEETSTPQALSRLALAVERFESLSKDERSCMSGHPFFGAMTYEEWHRTHLIHARHHIARFAGKGWLKEKGG